MAVGIGVSRSVLGAQRRVNQSSELFARSLERLSSGSRVNRASDDAAGLSVASQLQVRSRIYSQAIRNLNDGVSYLTIASSALSEAGSVTSRLLELAEQAANGTFSLAQRRSLDQEADALVSEFNRILAESRFNGVGIFSEENLNLVLQAGFGSEAVMFLRNGAELMKARGVGTLASALTTTTSTATDLVAADINGDGFADSIQSNGTNIIVRYGQGDGTFSASANTFGMGAASISELNLADTNGDGVLDAIARLSNGSFSVAAGASDGTFGSASNFTTGQTLQDFTVADFNGDGRVDILAVGNNGVFLLANTGGGSFGAATQLVSRSFSSGAINSGDIDGDGKLDLFVSGTNSNLSVFGTGSGGVASTVTDTTGFSGTPRTGVGDFNGDGLLDIVQYDALSGNTFALRLGDGRGSYSQSWSTSLSGSMTDLLVTDLNGDGMLDFVTSGAGGAQRVALGDGAGGFTVTASSTGAGQLAVGDINRDGVQDVMTLNTTILSGRIQATVQTGELAYLNLNSRTGALAALDLLTTTRERLAREIGTIGSHLARLDVGLSTLYGQREGSTGAAARILDVDVASEAANQLRYRLLQEAGAAVLAQATQAPRLAAQLLQF